MGWLTRKIVRWAERRERIELDHRQDNVVPMVAAKSGMSRGLDTEPVRFCVYNANGGLVVETQSINKHHDTTRQLHIITSDRDIGQEISKIITLTHLHY